jgi:hypothetical protein
LGSRRRGALQGEMPITTLSQETVGDFALGDARLIAIRWEHEGRDLRLDIVTGGGRNALLRCSWVTGLHLDLSWDATSGGDALSWGLEVRKSTARWHLLFEFPPQGKIEFECEEAKLELLE